jgi:hypothetical protein
VRGGWSTVPAMSLGRRVPATPNLLLQCIPRFLLNSTTSSKLVGTTLIFYVTCFTIHFI